MFDIQLPLTWRSQPEDSQDKDGIFCTEDGIFSQIRQIIDDTAEETDSASDPENSPKLPGGVLEIKAASRPKVIFSRSSLVLLQQGPTCPSGPSAPS